MDQMLFDWQTLVEAVRIWLGGGQPYQPYTYGGRLLHTGWFVYPPPFLIVSAPFAVLPWQLSGLLMLLLSVVGFEYWVRRSSGRSGLFWLIIWLPLLQGLWIGQISLLSLVGLALAELSYRDKHDRRAAVLLTLAILKPQTVVLPAAWLLLTALRERRWRMLGWFALVSLGLWVGVALIAGPQIYVHWLAALGGYDDYLPNRPLLWPPFGPLLGLLAALLWWRAGRHDVWGVLLLLNTLLYPLSVVYVAVGIAFVVVRWRPDWPWYPLALSWIIPLVAPLDQRTPDTIAAMTQAIVSTGLLAGLAPTLPWRRMLVRRSSPR